MTYLRYLPVLDLELLHNRFGCPKTPQHARIREDTVADAGFLVHLRGSSKHVLVVHLDNIVKQAEVDHCILRCKHHYYPLIAHLYEISYFNVLPDCSFLSHYLPGFCVNEHHLAEALL